MIFPARNHVSPNLLSNSMLRNCLEKLNLPGSRTTRSGMPRWECHCLRGPLSFASTRTFEVSPPPSGYRVGLRKRRRKPGSMLLELPHLGMDAKAPAALEALEGHRARADGAAAFANGEAQASSSGTGVSSANSTSSSTLSSKRRVHPALTRLGLPKVNERTLPGWRNSAIADNFTWKMVRPKIAKEACL